MRSFQPRLIVALGAVFVLALVAIIRHRVHDPGPPTSLSAQASLMGTEWRILVWPEAGQADTSVQDAQNAAFEEIARVEEVMSEWRPDSPISAVNRSAGEAPVEVPDELRQIIERSIQLSQDSAGAFDVTWRGMGPIWHFDEDFVPPSRDAVAESRRLVDFRDIVIDGSRVGLRRRGMAIGLGAIAKGYGIDRAGAVLRHRGFCDFLVDGGGDILVSGRNGNRPWSVGIRDPRGGPEDLIAIVRVEEGAVVTSGDYERFREIGGIRYHHIIDPRTGWPASACRSVTVVASTAETADALATTIFVLGPVEGLALAKSSAGVEALVIDSSGQYWMTKRFGEFAEFRD